MTDTGGLARFTYTGNAQGGDVVEARVENALGTAVVSGQSTVSWITAGCVSAPGTVTTDALGVAVFTLTGAIAGADMVSATDGTAVSNASTVNWVMPAQGLTTTTVYGRFFKNPDENEMGTQIAAGNGYIAGKDELDNFQAVFTGQFTVTSAGDAVLEFFNDDGFVFGVGPNAQGQQPTRVSGSLTNPPVSGRTAFENFPVMGAFNIPSAGGFGELVTVHFPGPGTYPCELDYAECCLARMILAMNVKTGPFSAQAAPLSRSRRENSSGTLTGAWC